MTPISGSAFAALILCEPLSSPEDIITAIDIDRVAGHGTRVLAREKDTSRTYFFDRHQTASGGSFRHSFHQGVEIGNSRGGSRRQRAGADRVHPDALGSELSR